MGFFARATCLGSIVLTAACSAGGGDGQGATSNGDAESSGEPTSAASTDADGGGSSGGAGSSDGGSDGGSTGGNDDVQVVPLRVDAFNVPTIETYYACFEFSFTLDQLGHIVGFAPQIDDAKHVHHFVLSKLDGPTGQSPGYSCFDLAGEMIYTWAPGGQTWELPPEAGFLIGDGEGGSVTLRLQVHYNNIGGDEGAVDSSGLDLQVARTLRPNNAGTMVFGDIDGIAIPPAMSAYEHVATCSGNATSTLLHELTHVITRIRGEADNDDWIAEGIAEFYGVELMHRTGGTTDARYQRTLEWLRDWGKSVKTLRTPRSSAETTARAVLLFVDLDQEIQRKTQGRKHIDDLTRQLMRLRKVSTAEFIAAAEKIAGGKLKSLDTPLLR